MAFVSAITFGSRKFFAVGSRNPALRSSRFCTPQRFSPIAAAFATSTRMGLTSTDTLVGTGTEVTPGKNVSVHYTLTLGGWEGQPGAKVVDSSRSRGSPFQYRAGAGQVIQGWDQGVTGMKIGGKRRLIIPPELGYGSRGAGDVIPGNSTLYFDIELLKVE